MSTYTECNMWVCTDCYFAHHYGWHEHEGQWFAGESDTPCDREPLARLADAASVADNTCSDHDTDGDTPCLYCNSADTDNGIDAFSSRQCQGCGSTLGGERFRLAVTFKVAP